MASAFHRSWFITNDEGELLPTEEWEYKQKDQPTAWLTQTCNHTHTHTQSFFHPSEYTDLPLGNKHLPNPSLALNQSVNLKPIQRDCDCDFNRDIEQGQVRVISDIAETETLSLEVFMVYIKKSFEKGTFLFHYVNDLL